jgi:hypothetical protein
MELLDALGAYGTFTLAVAAALVAGCKLLPLAELLLMDDLPDDSTNEA